MSLQIWLPLTKDARNQGLSNILITPSLTYTDGKIGKAATGSLRIEDGSDLNKIRNFLNSGGDFSVAFWLKVTNVTSGDIISYGNSSGTGTRLHIAVNNNVLRFGFRADDYDGATLTLNKWYHIVCSYSNSKKYMYIDGNLYGSKASGILNIPQTYISFDLSKSNLNDFRIYDHCLSPMEVKELAKGLVLHYPLNRQGWGQENLVWNSNWNIHSTTPPESWVNWGSPPTREIVTIDGKNWLHVISNTNQFQGYSQNWTKRNGTGELTANTKMTISFTAKLAVAASIAPIGIHWCNSSGTIVSQNWTTTTLTTNPKRYSFTYTTPADCVAFNIMVGDNTNTAHEVWITDIKLEFGEIATPWCPNSSDTLATTMSLNSATEYDCSGFCNNGTRIGTFTWTSDTPKYQVSTHIGATNQKIHISNFPTSGFGNSYSFAWWGKRNSNSPMFWGFSDGIRLNGMYLGTLWNTGDGSNNPIYKPNTTTTISAPSTGVWHHYVMTGDGTTCKLYLDGELYGQAKTYKAISGTSIWINGWDSGTQYCSDNTNISDFRIYATALSAADIKSLYQNSAYIDSFGNVYGAIHEEV